ncbi:MAG: PA14 domain-containing protein, partial [Planctomycetota bacterium]
MESLEDRRLLAVVWDRVEPLGSLMFESDVAGELGKPVEFFSDDFESGAPLGADWTTNSLKFVVTSLADADAMISGSVASSSVSASIDQADLRDVTQGPIGNWTFDNPIPGGGGNDYAVLSTGTFQVNTAGTFTFALGGDDGGRLRINGADVIVDDNLHAFTNVFGDATLAAGTHTFEWLGFERGGGAAFELSVAVGAGNIGPVTEANGWKVVGAATPHPEIESAGSLSTTAYYPLEPFAAPGGRIEVTNVRGTPANSGDFHLAMDRTPPNPFTLNEAVLTLDLSAFSEATLEFAHKDVGDEDQPLPAAFTGRFGGDGVSISADGDTWHTLVSLNNANSPNQVYTEFDFDLDQAAADAGISLGADFQIKFQQFDNFPFNSDGRTFDDIAIKVPGPLSETTTAFLEADQTLTVVATPNDSSTTLTATVRDPSNVVLATATASAPGETLEIQTIGIAADGDYTVEITGDAAGEYDLSLYRNAWVEVFDTDDGSEQDATGSFIPLGSASGRFGIKGEFFAGSDEGGDPLLFAVDWANPTPTTILTLDPADASIQATYDSPSHTTTNPFGINMAFDGEDLWYNPGAFFGDNTLYQIDAQSGTVLGSFVAVNSGDGFGLAYLQDELYYADASGIQVYSLDGTFQRSLPEPPGVSNLEGLAGDDAEGFLYAVSQSTDQLYRLDPQTGVVLASAAAPPVGFQQGLGVAGDELFVSETTGTGGVNEIAVYDKNTFAPLRRMPVAVTNFLGGLGGDGVLASFAPSGLAATASDSNPGTLGVEAAFDSQSTVPPTPAPVPSAQPDFYGDPGEPGRFPPGPNVPAQAVAPNELLVNGSFETGNFLGWTTVTTGSPWRPWNVSGSGQGGGFGMLQTQPQDGAFVAWNGFDGLGPMEFQMFQDVTIPAGSNATLSWMDRVQWNYSFGPVTLPRLYDVEIRDPGTNAILQTAFSFSTGTSPGIGNTNWQTHSVDVSAFAGQSVRLFFRQQIPEAFTGPGQVEIDAVSLTEEAAGTVETMYAGVGRGSSINPGGVLLVDQNTGAGTLVADPITPGGLTGLVVDGADRMWGSSIDGPLGNRVSNLVEIDPDTGALISSVPILDGTTPISIGDLAVQPGTDVIFGMRSSSDAGPPGGQLYTIDRVTGAATLVGDTFQNRNGGLGFAPDGRLFYLEFIQLHELDPTNAAILNTTNLNFG